MLARGTTIVGRYRIEEPEGHGGMSTVYRAVDLRLGGKRWAVKVLTLTDPDVAQHFLHEAQVLAQLEHPNLPTVGDHGIAQDGSFQFLVMQYILGVDLGTLLERRQTPFPLTQVLPWADQLLTVLTYLHTQPLPIIHRDIKPTNIKLTPLGQIVLLDFGIAKTMDTSGRHHRPRAAGPRQALPQRRPQDSIKMGTPHFSPPEQELGVPTDARSDLYSLGATLYTLLTGQPPADALQRFQALRQGAPDPLRPAHQVLAAIPAPISTVLAQALAIVPAQRFADAWSMQRALHAAVVPPIVRPPAQREDWRELLGATRPNDRPAPVSTPALWFASAVMVLGLVLMTWLG